ncbi:hypothetical protein ACRRTK_011670 [Alexandromys fortis]
MRSKGIQTCSMIELRDEDDLVPEKLYLAREITAFHMESGENVSWTVRMTDRY